MPVTEQITADEYLALDLDRRHELIDGRIVVNEPRLPHAVLSMRLIRALDDWCRAGDDRGLVTIPIDVGVDRYNVYAPDLLWYGAAHAPSVGDARAPAARRLRAGWRRGLRLRPILTAQPPPPGVTR